VRLACCIPPDADGLAHVGLRLNAVVLAAVEALHLWEGLAVELVPVPSPEAALFALWGEGGCSADLACTTELCAARGHAEGRPLRVLCAALLQPAEEAVGAVFAEPALEEPGCPPALTAGGGGEGRRSSSSTWLSPPGGPMLA